MVGNCSLFYEYFQKKISKYKLGTVNSVYRKGVLFQVEIKRNCY